VSQGLRGGLALTLCFLPGLSAAQSPPAPVSAPPEAEERPGLLALGPFFLTPSFHIGTVGIDTNVFYTATDRRTDFTASGGPGLELVLPVGWFRFITGGDANYTYFAKTESQRRFGGDARARAEARGNRLQLGIEGDFAETFQRPSFEVDTRIVQDRWALVSDLTVNAGFVQIKTLASTERLRVPMGQNFLGTDLGVTLSRDEHRAVLGFEFPLSGKTSFLVEGDYQLDRFPSDHSRNADSNRIDLGFEVKSATRLSGRAVGGVRLFRPTAVGVSGLQRPYANVNLKYQFGPKTFISGTYLQDLNFSAFTVIGDPSTLDTETYQVTIEKGLFKGFDLQIFGGITHFKTRGPVTIMSGPGSVVTAVREDTARQGGADLGYLFKSKVRIGVAATYTDRTSTFADFGIQGLLVGGTVKYAP